ncbi:hypothetical protein FIBSPDRAFT_887656 [Athelia psychrophila]|uniref:Uncharacterized protein n=1 Tax=Athelia psychrophila TaxID=1759441 RepID=A0A166PDG4_9AGAM|nr:hypothetical protein FIBSPDRAFT_887656 [Fibularhizoctonia sp. CBS 109695]
MQTTFSQLYYPRLVPSEACLIHALNLSLAPVAQDEAVEVHKEETVVALDTPVYPAAPYGDAEAEPTGEAKEPQMMSKDEAREDGAVKWSIYNTYLRASSYWAWGYFNRPHCCHAALGRRRETVHGFPTTTTSTSSACLINH